MPLPISSLGGASQARLSPLHALPINVYQWFMNSVVPATILDRSPPTGHGTEIIDDAESAWREFRIESVQKLDR
jgi:hypothetical protein